MTQVLFTLLAAPSRAVPPATVLEHSVEVRIPSSGRAEETVRWRVRIDDPAASSAGLPAPPGLEGARDQGAVILDELLVLPTDLAIGATFTLESTHPTPQGSRGGLFHTAPGLPTEHASVLVEAPLADPLTVWADESATPSFATRATRRVSLGWEHVPADELAEAVWSTWRDWDEAGEPTRRALSRKLSSKEALGRAIAQDIEGLGPAGIAERVFAAVALDEGPPGDWASARRASEIAKDGHGTAAERGVVLIAALATVGIEARAGWFRPNTAPGSFPVTVPAPELLPRPVVAIPQPEGPGAEPFVYIDPASPWTAIPDLPAAMLGATVWLPGELPVPLPERSVTDGTVSITTRLTLAQDGSASWSADVEATSAAAEILRQRLASLDDGARTEVFSRMVGAVRSDLERVTVSSSNLGRADRDLSITVAGGDPTALSPTTLGLRGEIAPLLATALAAWLPPRISVTETVAVGIPSAMRIIGASCPRSASHPTAAISRSLQRSGPRLSTTTTVVRPDRRQPLARESAAQDFLAQQATTGIDLLLIGEGSGPITRRLRAETEMSPAERAVLEALIWRTSGSLRKAQRVITKAATADLAPVVEALVRHDEPPDSPLWQSLQDLAAESGANAIIRVALGLEQVGGETVALEHARAALDTDDPATRLEALLMVARLQGPPPVPELERERAATYMDPLLLSERAREAADRAGTAATDPRPAVLTAGLLLDQGRANDAAAALDGLDPQAFPTVAILSARAGAARDLPAPEAKRQIHAAIAAAPDDPEVQGAAAAALFAIDEPHQALASALIAARLASNPDRWDQVVPIALAAADLPTAANAARRASDLDPESRVRALRWSELATLALDRPSVDEASQRAGTAPPEVWPLSLAERISLDDTAMLAVLVAAEEEVAADPDLLAVRAELRIAARDLDGAARDGLLLATRHGLARGWALSFAATAGRQYSTQALRALDLAARTEPTAMMTRLEYHLVAGSGDPLVDARQLGDDLRARALIQATTLPQLVAASLKGWPRSLPAPSTDVPPGFRPNRALSTISGVIGFSNPEAAIAIIRVGAASGAIPPPIALLYSSSALPIDVTEGGWVYRLDGGVMPLYAANAVDSANQEVWGLGFTVAGAKLALSVALERP